MNALHVRNLQADQNVLRICHTDVYWTYEYEQNAGAGEAKLDRSTAEGADAGRETPPSRIGHRLRFSRSSPQDGLTKSASGLITAFSNRQWKSSRVPYEMGAGMYMHDVGSQTCHLA